MDTHMYVPERTLRTKCSDLQLTDNFKDTEKLYPSFNFHGIVELLRQSEL